MAMDSIKGDLVALSEILIFLRSSYPIVAHSCGDQSGSGSFRGFLGGPRCRGKSLIFDIRNRVAHEGTEIRKSEAGSFRRSIRTGVSQPHYR